MANWVRNLTWPVGHFVLLCRGWRPFTMRRRRHWWYLPWYEQGNLLMPYTDALKEPTHD